MSSQAQTVKAFQDSNNVVGTNSTNIVALQREAITRVQPLHSEWMSSLGDRFDELTSLPYGWDGYNGQPVSFARAFFAAHLLESLYISELDEPQLVPGSDGTVQIEWHENGFDLEIDVQAPYDVVATRCNLNTGHAEELELDTDFTVLANWIRDLGSAEEQVGGQ